MLALAVVLEDGSHASGVGTYVSWRSGGEVLEHGSRKDAGTAVNADAVRARPSDGAIAPKRSLR